MSAGLLFGVLAVVAVGLTLRTIWGFGDGMVGVPLLALFIGLDRAAPLMVGLSVIMAIGLLREQPELIERATVLRVLIGAVLGTPFGVLVLVDLDPTWTHRALGLVLLGFGLGSLLVPRSPGEDGESGEAPRASWLLDLGFGALAGASSAAFDIAGPPLLIHAALRGWDPDRIRLNLQAVFLPLALISAGGHAFAGLWTEELLIYAAASLPIAALGLLFGRNLRARFSGERGQRWVYGLIAALGLGELVRTWL